MENKELAQIRVSKDLARELKVLAARSGWPMVETANLIIEIGIAGFKKDK